MIGRGLLLLAFCLPCMGQSRYSGDESVPPASDDSTLSVQPPDPMPQRPQYMINSMEIEAWPAWLRDNGLMDGAERGVRLLDAQIAEWSERAPQLLPVPHPVPRSTPPGQSLG